MEDDSISKDSQESLENNIQQNKENLNMENSNKEVNNSENNTDKPNLNNVNSSQEHHNGFARNPQSPFSNLPNQYHIPGQSPQKPKKGVNGWMWAFIISIIILGISILLNLVLGIASIGRGATSSALSSQSTSYVMGDKGNTNKILEIRITGTIMNDGSDNIKKNMIKRVKNELDYAKKEKDIKAILLTIDSPGGGITATDLIYNDIQKFKAERNIPIVAYCEDITASGGYYIASASDCIYATRTSLVGSIGVISQFMDMEQLFKKVGIRWNVITSNKANGKKSYKDIGSFSREMTAEEKAFMQSIVQEMWEGFVDVVAEGRKGKLTKEEVANLADGRIYTGKKALALKLVDKIGYKEDAVNELKSMSKIDAAEVVTCTYAAGSLKDLFESSAEKSIIPSAKELLDEGSPKLMFLWNGKN